MTDKIHIGIGFMTPAACGTKARQQGVRIMPWSRRHEVTCERCRAIVQQRLAEQRKVTKP